MKKIFPLIVLALSLGSLSGCSPSEPTPDPGDLSKISRISFSGVMNKKHYAYNDEWDLSGLSVKATTVGGNVYSLTSNKYTITFNKKAPKNLTTSLQITAKLKGDASKMASVSYNDIIVDDEIYDNKSEVEKYYEGVNLNLSGTNLLKTLQNHSFEKHTYFVKYGETSSLLAKGGNGNDYEAPDLVPNEHKIEMLYTGNKTQYSIGNREHVWACANSNGLWEHGKVDDVNYIGAGSDLYHVRPCNVAVNKARGNATFVDFDHNNYKKYKSSVVEIGDGGPYKLKIYGANKVGSNYEYARYVEPADQMKGDIARIIAYVYMHYRSFGDNHNGMAGTLNLSNIFGFANSEAGSILKEWNRIDPVSPVETRRNHTVQQIQGNRNPFVDYPNLIDKAF